MGSFVLSILKALSLFEREPQALLESRLVRAAVNALFAIEKSFSLRPSLRAPRVWPKSFALHDKEVVSKPWYFCRAVALALRSE